MSYDSHHALIVALSNGDCRIDIPSPSNHDSTDTHQEAVDHKCYVQREAGIHQHNLWHLDGFWEDALLEGVMSQLSMMEAVLWDEQDPEQLKEKVIGAVVMSWSVWGGCAFLNNFLPFLFALPQLYTM